MLEGMQRARAMHAWNWILAPIAALASLTGTSACAPAYPPSSRPAPATPAPVEPAGDGDGFSHPVDPMPGAERTGPDSYAGIPSAEPARAGGARAAASPAAAWIDAHNRYRAKHCAAALSWSAKLAAVAQRWANSLRDRGCAFGHSGGSYGENLAAGTSGTLDAESVVKMWYDEVAQYRFPDGGFSMKTGHFTQVVWRGTTQVGCATSRCNGMDIFVCEYNPAGNWEGQYRSNVLPRGC